MSIYTLIDGTSLCIRWLLGRVSEMTDVLSLFVIGLVIAIYFLAGWA